MVLNKESDSMSANEYLKAQKLGEKRYQAAVAKNEYPYLPVLPHEDRYDRSSRRTVS